MKSNYAAPVNRARLKNDVLKLAECMMRERETEIRESVQDSVASQTMAVVFWVLHREHGWGRKRLTQLRNEIEDEFVLMHKGIMGRTYTAIDLREWLKANCDIDFSETQYKGGID